jgi:N-acetyl-anhydromuramyl-L-alanine amidase AmpD
MRLVSQFWTKLCLNYRTLRGYTYWLPKLNYRLRDQAGQIRNLLWERDLLKTWLAQTYVKTMPDFPDATWQPISRMWTGHAGKLPRYVIIHTTQIDLSATEVAKHHEDADESVHYIIDQDAKVFQCVSEEHSSINLMELLPGSALFWSSAHIDGHINYRAFTIEVLFTGKQPTNKQFVVLFVLTKNIMTRHQIPMQIACETGGVTGHFSLDPKNHPDCGRSIPYDDLQHYLQTDMLLLPVGGIIEDSTSMAIVSENSPEVMTIPEPEKPKRITKVKAADVE